MPKAPTPHSLPPKPARRKLSGPKRAFGRSLSDFPKLSDAEQQLVACCAQGEICGLGDGSRPEAATDANTIRAELIRFLALGGDATHPVHEEGVMLRGGWIKGELSLHQAQAAVRLDLQRCHFDSEPIFTAARLPELGLTGSSVPGFRADRMTVTGSVFLRQGFAATNEIRLPGAKIGGSLECAGGSFTNAGGTALNADGIELTGGVFWNYGFSATGEVRLLGAQIGGNLECNGGNFTNEGGKALNADGISVKGDVALSRGFAATGEVRLIGAQISGDLSCIGGSFTNSDRIAIHTQGVRVTGGLLLRGASIEGAVNLTAATVSTLVDDAKCWWAGGHILDGLQYDRIIGSTDARMRIKWLKQQHDDELSKDFAPQPWEQLITVFRAMGHPHEAEKVAMAKQKQLRVARTAHKPKWRRWLGGPLNWIYGAFAGYGHRPLRIVYWMTGVCVACSCAFYAGRETGHFGPTSPLIHASYTFEACGAPGETGTGKKAKPFWTSPDCPTPPEYTTFQPFFYSLDLILPLVDLHQEADWAPLVVNAAGKTLWPGRILRWMVWFEILFGWVASLTLVAVLGRLVDKD